MANADQTNTKIERPPVIAIMGHIDHGKSTLLDYIRKTNIVSGEAGGITQHISAYEVKHENQRGIEKKITFLDTPGHEAFQAMRERGAEIADIAILIVSAEEGVKAQTLEALRAITESNIPYIVAINKIDRPNANIDRTKQILSENNILIEEYGGKIPCVPISAKTGEGVNELLDMMLLVAEMEELTGNPKSLASGYVLESKLDQRAGITATLVIKDGVLNIGNFVCVGNEIARIKKMDDFLGKNITEATFSTPVSVSGFCHVPTIGASFRTFNDKKSVEKFLAENQELVAQMKKCTKEEVSDENKIVVPVIVKADVAGSLEALEREINRKNSEEAVMRVVQTGIGTITENDIKLATGSANTVTIGFHVGVDRAAVDLAERLNLPIKTFDIIYKMSEWLDELILERAPKKIEEKIIGRAKILKIFSKNKDKQVIGGTVLEGNFVRGKKVRIVRREVEIGHGHVDDLESKKLKTSEVSAPEQFGTVVDSKHLIAVGDILETIES